jgi:hypothetical protein
LIAYKQNNGENNDRNQRRASDKYGAHAVVLAFLISRPAFCGFGRFVFRCVILLQIFY